MICTKCNQNEITSKITGELCTSCYFESKKPRKTVTEAKEEIASVIKELESRAELESPELIESEIKDCPLNHDKIKKDLIDSGTIGNCPNCDEVLVIDEDLNHQPKKITEVQDPDKKYCQSCIERGYGLVLATREWTPDYFICDDCFTPLINNILNINDEDIRAIKENPEIDLNKPILNQFYDLLEIPEALRIQSPEKVLNSRNDIFNYHAPAILNKEVETIKREIEQYQVMLFQIKIAIEPRQDYINRVKHEERQKKNLDSIEKGKKEFSKTGPSKVKSSQDQKMADTLYKLVEPNAEKRLKMYLDLQKQAREQEFKNRTGT